MRANRNKKKFLLSILAGAFAAFAVFGSLDALNKKIDMQSKQIAYQSNIINNFQKNGLPNTQITVDSKQKFNYVKAVKEIKVGTVITSDLLAMQTYDSKLSQVFTNKLNLIGKIASIHISKDKLIKKDFVIESTFEKENIPVGMRAVTIPVRDIEGLASYIRVGTKVDILYSKNNKSTLILQNVKIVSLEPLPGKSSENTFNATNASAITIQIPANSSAKLINSMKQGKLLFTTRGLNDNATVKVRNYSSSNNSIPTKSTTLPGFPPGLKSLNTTGIPFPATPSKTNVEIIQANIKTQVNFEND